MSDGEAGTQQEGVETETDPWRRKVRGALGVLGAFGVVGILGVIADLIEVSGAVADGGSTLVWAISLGTMLAGGCIVWKHMRGEVNKTLVVSGVAIVVAGSVLFGYLLGDRGSEVSAADSSTNATDGTGSPASGSETSVSDASSSTGATTPSSMRTSPSSTSTSRPSPTTAPPMGRPLYLTDLHPISGGMLAGEWTIDGTRYAHGLGTERLCGYDIGTATYNLDGSYRQFQATVGGTEEMYDSAEMEFMVELDGLEIARQPATRRQPQSIDVDVSGGDELRLTVTDGGGNCIFNGTAVWGDPRIIP